MEGKPGLLRSEVVSVSVGDRKTQPLFSSAYRIKEVRVSPDGQWLAYVSDETGRPEVYVRRVLGQAGAAQVSLAGGKQPRWRGDGKGIFYLGLDSSIMEVDVHTGPRFASLPPKAIVRATQHSTMDLYAVSKDAQQFLVVVYPQSSSYTLMLNWTSRIEKRSK